MKTCIACTIWARLYRVRFYFISKFHSIFLKISFIVLETLRKYTVVPHLNRQALADYQVPGHPKFVIKKGMSVLIPTYAIHHDPDLYPEPEEFNPDRFSSVNVKQRD